MSYRASRRRTLRSLALPLLAAGHRAPVGASSGPSGAIAAAIAALSSPDAVAHVPAGDHPFDNPLIFRRRSGTLRLEPGARLLPLRPGAGGLRFDDCADLLVEGLRLEWSYSPRVSRSHHGAGMMLVTSSRVAVRDCEILGAPGAGLHVDTCAGVRLDGVRVARTLADGVHIANSRDVVGSDLRTRDTGDDGIGCVDYAHAPAGGGILLRGVDVEGSRARGVAIVGASDVEVEGFTVRRTASSGVLVATDVHFRTRRPARVSLRGGLVDDAGRLEPGAGNRFGVEVIAADDVSVRDVRVAGARSRSVSVVDTGGTAVLSGVEVAAPDARDGACLECRGNARVAVEQAALDGSGGSALDAEANGSLELERIVLRSRAGGVARVRVNGPGRVAIGDLRVAGEGSAHVRLGAGVRGTIVAPDRERVVLDLSGASIELRGSQGGESV
jgi:hypothetical protein